MWLPTTVFAELAQVSEQAARSAFSRCATGGDWRGDKLAVRPLRGRGGKSGLRYEVRLDSLPADLQARYRELHGGDAEASGGGDGSAAGDELADGAAWPAVMPKPRHRVDAFTGFRLRLVQSVIAAGDAGSPQRARKIDELAASERYPEGRKRGRPVSPQTLRQWVASYDKNGIHGLARKTRADDGTRRVVISRPWDAAARAAGLTSEAMQGVKGNLVRRIQSEWASGAPDSSVAAVQMKVLAPFMKWSREAGIALGNEALRSICAVSAGLVRGERRFRLIAVWKRDAGRFNAEVASRITRDRSLLRPSEWIAADVHHVDIVIRRDDGSLCTPKLVAFEDLATNRLFWRVFLLPKGESIRREHVIETFIALCADPDWGQPDGLYCDNGGEFTWVEIADNLSRMKKATILCDEVKPRSTRSRPYQPQGKVIEGLFARLERLLSHIPGHVGGDRMKKKCENLGKTPTAFNGDFEVFKGAFTTAVNTHHAKPQRGHLKGKSPNDRFAEFCDQGWKAVVVDKGALEMAFRPRGTRKIGAGGTFTVSGRSYQHDSLSAFVGETFTVLLPLNRGDERIAVLDNEGNFQCAATPDQAFLFGDRAGAEEQVWRQREQTRQLKDMKKMVDPVDQVASLEAYACAQRKPKHAERSNVVHMPDAELGKAARAVAAVRERATAAEKSEAETAADRRRRYEEADEEIRLRRERRERRQRAAAGQFNE